MSMDRTFMEPLYLLCPFVKVYALNVVTSLSDWTLNGDVWGIRKSPVNPKDLLNIRPPMQANQKMLTNL